MPVRALVSFSTPGILSRYLAAGFLRIFLLSLGFAALMYFIVDFFDRIDNFLNAQASASGTAKYFLFKTPLYVSRVFGVATLFSAFFSLGLLARGQEIIALRACGVSLRAITVPLLGVSLLIGLISFFWNESLVPIFTRQSESIYKSEVKKAGPKSLIGTHDLWVRSPNGFLTADYFDPRRNVLEGVALYVLDRDFTLKSILEARSARWNGRAWEGQAVVEWTVLPQGQITGRPGGKLLPVSQTPDDFIVFAREPEEFSFFELKREIAELRRLGVDVTEYQVDLQAKLAFPLAAPLLALLGIPFALRIRHGTGMAMSCALTMAIGLGYWFLMAFSLSLGHSGALPPWLAAWLPNSILTLLGLYFLSDQD